MNQYFHWIHFVLSLFPIPDSKVLLLLLFKRGKNFSFAFSYIQALLQYCLRAYWKRYASSFKFPYLDRIKTSYCLGKISPATLVTWLLLSCFLNERYLNMYIQRFRAEFVTKVKSIYILAILLHIPIRKLSHMILQLWLD